MQKREYHLVDVFTDRQFGGNQLAVFTEADGISDEMMQTIARELNLSETVFVVTPDDTNHECRLRIFTPKREMPIAGHPTVGTGYVLQHTGLIAAECEVVFEEGVGPIPVKLSMDDRGVRVEMRQPIPEFGTVYEDRAFLAEMLSIPVECIRDDVPAQVGSAGVPFIYIPIVSLEAMSKLKLRYDLWEQGANGIDIFALTTETVQPDSVVHSRMFAPSMNIPEDPATGAASGPLGAYLFKYGLVTPEKARDMVGEQGFEMGRPSLIGISVETEGDTITRVSINGYTQQVGGGYILLPD